MGKVEYTVRSRDVAHILDCSPDEVVELAERRKLRATKRGRLRKYRVEDVLEYKKSRENKASDG